MQKENIQVHHLGKNQVGVDIVQFSLQNVLQQMKDEIVLPHRHDHYSCFFIRKGSLNLIVDFKDVTMSPASLLVSYPGQIHQLVSVEKAEGWMLSFNTKMVNENARIIIEQSFSNVALLQLNKMENEWVSGMFKIICATLNEKQPAIFQHQLLQSLVNAFFYKITAIFQLQENEYIQEYSSRSVEITKKFRLLLQQHLRSHKKPSQYADKMNLSASYLNDTVKSVTGFPVTYFIQQEVLAEAQRLLIYTPMSVKEIALDLGYEDYKYFIRLFGKVVGVSPLTYKKNKTNS